MNYKNSSSYVQRQTNKLLRSYKVFAKAYVNDIIIHFDTLSEHITHLRILFKMFRRKRISLTTIKSFLTYLSIILLKQRVDNLNMFTIAKKIAVITSFRFSFHLRDLKIFMKLIDWLRFFISRYVQKTQSLQKRKITLTKDIINIDSFKKRQINKTYLYDSIYEKQIAFRDLQTTFVSFTFFIHFDKNRRLYIDLNVFKQWNFVVIVYHVLNDSSNDEVYSRTAIQSIMFLNRCLNETEKNYWSIELKVVDIIWIMRKIRHMIESIEVSSTIIYTNHSIVVFISRQITLIIFSSDKLNLRLMKTSQYLSEFNLFIRHKVDKVNVMSNAFFRFQTNVFIIEKIEMLKSLYEHSLKSSYEDFIAKTSLFYHHVALMKMSNDFKRRLKQTYRDDEYWFKILDMIQSAIDMTSSTADVISKTNSRSSSIVRNRSSTSITDNHLSSQTTNRQFSTSITNNQSSNQTTNRQFSTSIINSSSKKKKLSDSRDIRFRHKNDLLYFIFDLFDSERLCISKIMKTKIFRQAHDLTHHDDFMRTYDRLRHFIYVRFMIKRLKIYIAHCSKCQINQIKRHSIYDELTSIISSAISFHIIIMNFIITLSLSRDFDVLLIITCKFSKKVLLIVDHNI